MSKKTAKHTLAGSGVQQNFLSRLKKVLPPGLGLAEELADLLDISTDSAYRRIRGETGLTLEELCLITKKHPVSIDELFSRESGSVTFGYTKLTDSSRSFYEYLSRMNDQLLMLQRYENRKMYYIAAEMPMYYSFGEPLLTDFRLFYWMRSVLNLSEYQHLKYEPGIVPTLITEMARNCYTNYFRVPGVEIWTDLTVTNTLRQMSGYHKAGLVTDEHMLQLLQEFRNTIALIQRNAQSGRKQLADLKETFRLYTTDTVPATGCVLTVMGEFRYVQIAHNPLNAFITSDASFCDETGEWITALKAKSQRISGAQAIHHPFFISMFRLIDAEIEKVRRL
jgi:hypothetical protein